MTRRLVLAALLLLLVAAVSPAVGQERSCVDDREQLRALARNLSESRLSVEAMLAEAQVQLTALRRQIEEMKKTTPAPSEKKP